MYKMLSFCPSALFGFETQNATLLCFLPFLAAVLYYLLLVLLLRYGSAGLLAAAGSFQFQLTRTTIYLTYLLGCAVAGAVVYICE